MKNLLPLLCAFAVLIGCSNPNSAPKVNNGNPSAANISGVTDDFPSFSLSWSEYPSWSVFGVAGDRGLLNGEKGQYGELEKKWKVDIVLNLRDYDTCLTEFGTSSCDMVCATNIDILKQAVKRSCTAIMPTSTSDGADACLVIGIDSPEQLKDHPVRGLDQSVSEYAFFRCLEQMKLNPDDFKFTPYDPDKASIGLQTEKFDAIMVWNPFVLQTLKTQPKAKRLFDSSLIPREIIDMVVMANDSLARKGGEEAACCVIDAFYGVMRMLDDPKIADSTYKAIGERFSSLDAEEMKQCLVETKAFKTTKDGIAVFTDPNFRDTMDKVVSYCRSRGMIKDVTIGYSSDDTTVEIDFNPQYMKTVETADASNK